jgi:Mg2+ and Co2+ transporter CorA
MVASLQYQYKNIDEKSKYVIGIVTEKDIELQIEDITVNFYEYGVGIFAFHLNNYNESDFNRILKINEYGRRIYPQFLGKSGDLTIDTKYNFLANKIELQNVISNYSQIIEDFSYYNSMRNIDEKGCFNLPNHIQCLLGNHFTGNNSNLEERDLINIAPIIDDRMFVITHLFDDGFLKELKTFNKKSGEYAYQKSKKWYRYVFVDDSNASCESRLMLKKLLTKHTYDRWIEKTGKDKNGEVIHSGQLYGLSRYSFVLLTGESGFTRNIISNHIKTMYFEMVMLSLLQRAYIIYFGNEVTRISKHLKHSDSDFSNCRKDISLLCLNYIRFVNRIYFREITPQEQGIELYDLLQKQMRIKEYVEDLDNEIQELNNYIETIEQSNLSRVANWFLPVALFAGVLGMNTIPSPADSNHFLRWLLTTLSIIVICWTVIIFYKQYKKLIKSLWTRIRK